MKSNTENMFWITWKIWSDNTFQVMYGALYWATALSNDDVDLRIKEVTEKKKLLKLRITFPEASIVSYRK